MRKEEDSLSNYESLLGVLQKNDMATEAALIFQTITKRALLKLRHHGTPLWGEWQRGDVPQSISDLRVDNNAIIWRHWYTTLIQFMDDVQENESSVKTDELLVVPLPGAVSTAGQWYLGVPRGSIAPRLAITFGLAKLCDAKILG